MKDENNLIIKKTFDFAEQIIYLYIEFKEQKEYILAGQLVRSGTSIGANVEEAMAGQSTKDFVSKMHIANKEARETRYWLKLLKKTQVVKRDYDVLIFEINSIINILTAIIKTTNKNMNLQ